MLRWCENPKGNVLFHKPTEKCVSVSVSVCVYECMCIAEGHRIWSNWAGADQEASSWGLILIALEYTIQAAKGEQAINGPTQL